MDNLYPRVSSDRRHLIREAKATNYGVVRLELIEKLYELMYDQRRELGSDEKQWPHRIMNSRRVISCEPIKGDRLRLRVKPASATADEVEDLQADNGEEEEFDADLVVCATGYKRDAHVGMLQSMWGMLPQLNGAQSTPSEDRKYKVPVFDSWEVQPPADSEDQGTRSLSVGRDYKVRFAPDAVAPGSGVYLQGCCEGTHGVSCCIFPCIIAPLLPTHSCLSDFKPNNSHWRDQNDVYTVGMRNMEMLTPTHPPHCS